ncbi:ABC transporter permease [Frankia sp. CcI49]|uniref:ABC transporter permease n=1 Tax=unclassified Frankia TaxID=2632575 RepID=UPI0006C9F704|nr:MULTISPECIES: ABC transporter permease [unclassified Frankia]KPM50899.1 ABC transporter permease [Frankia sp. R43]ONH60718.1 ABC transporter permease [Frankia sp. CcI49]
MSAPRVGRLSPADIARLGAVGLRSRPLRVSLSALGIAIGIGAMLAVVGISASSHAELDQTLSRLGTNLLTVAPGNTVFGESTKLPAEAVQMIDRIGPVETAAATGKVPAYIYRNDHIPPGETGSIEVLAVDRDLPGTVHAELSAGSWLTPATATYPAVVLGAQAAQRLDLNGPGTRVWLGRQWYAVVGVLAPVPLAPELDSAALIGWTAAKTYAGFDGHPTTVYVRTVESEIAATRSVLGRTANPANPEEVAVSRPSDALKAKEATDDTLTALLLGLGAVALLVGGVGVANTMVISVLERRAEIGLRRSLGATRGHVRAQFLSESLLLSGLGGGGGVALGVVVTGIYAITRGWPPVVPGWATVGGFTATLVIGVLAGLYPAVRASRVTPAEALSSS